MKDDLKKEILKERIRERIVVKSRVKAKVMLIIIGAVISFFGAYLLSSAIYSANIWIIAWDVLVIFTGFVLIFIGLMIKERK